LLSILLPCSDDEVRRLIMQSPIGVARVVIDWEFL